MKATRFLPALLSILLPALAGPALAQWTIEEIGAPDVGLFTSVDLDASGHVHISYVDFVAGEIWYATDSGGAWTTEKIASIWGVWEGDTSIAVEPTGIAHVCYYDDSYGDLMYATNASGAWVTETIDSSGDTGWYNDLVLHGGAVHVSYYPWSGGNMKYATNATGSWIPETVDSTGDVGAYNSLAIDSTGQVHISYNDYTLDDCKYATNAGGTWSSEVVDIYGGDYTSIAVDSSGAVHIAYASQMGLEHATKVGGVWVDTVLDSGGRLSESSLVIDAADNLHIVSTLHGLTHATNATGAWTFEEIDCAASRGWPSAALDPIDGRLHVSYYDYSNYRLRYATTGKAVLYGCGVNPAESLTLIFGAPAIGTTLTLGVDNPLGTQDFGSLPFLVVSMSPDPGFPCGTLVPNFGMAGPGAFGELLVSIVPPDPAAMIPGPMWTGAGRPAEVPLPVPPDPLLVGMTAYAQGLLFDPPAYSGVRFGLTEAMALHIEL